MSREKRVKTVTITDGSAVQLINQRASQECRTAASAATITILEALGGLKGQRDDDDTGGARDRQ